MTNEQTIDAVCSELVRYSETVHGGASRAMRSAEHALLSQARQIVALTADAERYRWLKSRPVAVPADGPDLALWADCCGDELRGNEADKAIDAAMKAGS